FSRRTCWLLHQMAHAIPRAAEEEDGAPITVVCEQVAFSASDAEDDPYENDACPNAPLLPVQASRRPGGGATATTTSTSPGQGAKQPKTNTRWFSLYKKNPVYFVLGVAAVVVMCVVTVCCFILYLDGFYIHDDLDEQGPFAPAGTGLSPIQKSDVGSTGTAGESKQGEVVPEKTLADGASRDEGVRMKGALQNPAGQDLIKNVNPPPDDALQKPPGRDSTNTTPDALQKPSDHAASQPPPPDVLQKPGDHGLVNPRPDDSQRPAGSDAVQPPSDDVLRGVPGHDST
ncbi:unnamed protein product, partial [Amoebophrya sp. A120]